MASKRSRSSFEADTHTPFAAFGTPLPDEADGIRDDGSYLPLWKQDVRDEKGRRRLHGAFTGGWSAGYFNTVGSKEGWTPSTFTSSRSNRRKEDAAPNSQRAEDYMDEEDLADAAEAEKLQTSQAFAGLGTSTENELRATGLVGLFRVEGDTMGLKLLRRMGWKDGQGVGPKIRRHARLDATTGTTSSGNETFLFAPDNSAMVKFVRKSDRKGLGYYAEARLSQPDRENEADRDEDDDVDGNETRWDKGALLSTKKSKTRPERGGIGVGILNDGSDDEDPYEMGPKIKYNRVVGGDKKQKTKKSAALMNPALKNAPVFVPKTARAGNGLRRCHDGRLPLDGFALGRLTESLSQLLSEYAPPAIPEGWTPKKSLAADESKSAYKSAADAAKASAHGPGSRAAILGEKALPGKSVFDFMSSTARDQLAAASGRPNLPPARGEIPEGYAQSEEERQQALLDQIPKLDRETAAAAISRSSGGPYADDEAKRARYREYLDWHLNPGQPPPRKVLGMGPQDYLREMREFHNCARIFKPMTGFMASRFTTSKTLVQPFGSAKAETTELVSAPDSKIPDAAEEAARMGMFGKLTRSVETFNPTRLLCKRFNVKAPEHSQAEHDRESTDKANGHSTATASYSKQDESETPPLASIGAGTRDNVVPRAPLIGIASPPNREAALNPERNEALESSTANAEVLRAIFGDSDSDDDE